jgi:hypothetical protein
MQDRMTMSSSLRRIAAVARKTAVVAGSALFLSSVFALGADEARSQLRLHAGHSAPALSSAILFAFATYQSYKASRDERKMPASAFIGFVIGLRHATIERPIKPAESLKTRSGSICAGRRRSTS